MMKTSPHHRTSTAVMARRTEPGDGLDFFPTPPWATRALMEHCWPIAWEAPDAAPCRFMSAADPACGEGHIAGVLAEYFDTVFQADIARYDGLFGPHRIADFLDLAAPKPVVDWYVINPPFRLASDFIVRALNLATTGVAALVRTAFAEGQGRYADLFRHRPPQWECQFVERVPMTKGRWSINARSATAYMWLIWLKNPTHAAIRAGTRKMWIPPCRLELTHHDDVMRFKGCSDLPHDHPVTKALREQARAA